MDKHSDSLTLQLLADLRRETREGFKTLEAQLAAVSLALSDIKENMDQLSSATEEGRDPSWSDVMTRVRAIQERVKKAGFVSQGDWSADKAFMDETNGEE